MRRVSPYWILMISILILLIIPNLIKDGMFMDGVQYACIAKNMANGLGSFWHPFLSSTWYKSGSSDFLEHPPLVFGIQSQLFRIFGDSMYVERIYTFLTAVFTAFIIILTWKSIFKNNNEVKKLAWLPVLLWILMPLCSWSYQNNVQENTMGVFTLLSIYFILDALINKQQIILKLIISGIFIFCSSFSKGIPGLFPLATIFFYWLVYRDIRFTKIFLYLLILLLIPSIIYFILLQDIEAINSLKFYVVNRLLYRINDEPTVTSRFYIAGRLLIELVPLIFISIILAFIAKKKKGVYLLGNHKGKLLLLLILIGFAGSLPLMLTYVQRAFYFVPSLPLFALAFSVFLIPYFEVLNIVFLEKMKWFRLLAFTIFIASISVSFLSFGKIGRDKDILNDTYLIGKAIHENKTVSCEKNVYDKWQFQLYLIRYFNIYLDPSSGKKGEYYIIEKSQSSASPEGYRLISLNTKNYNLFEKISQ